MNTIHGSINKIHVLRTKTRRRVLFVLNVFKSFLKNETPRVFSILGQLHADGLLTSAELDAALARTHM